MRPVRIVFNVLAFGALLQAQDGVQRQSPAVVVGRFCQLDASGMRLTPTGAKEMATQLMLDESPPEELADVIVIGSFSVRSASIDTAAAEFAIDYQVLGRIDSSLGFARLHSLYSNQPLPRSERVSLVLTDTHFAPNANGKLQPAKGPRGWRIKRAPAAPHISLLAAIQYVRLAGNRTKDPIARAAAQKTLADLEVLSQLQSQPVPAAEPSQQQPEEILSQFAQMQMEGAGLNPSESEIGIFLVHPAQWRQDKIGVARGFGVKRTSFDVNKAEAYVQYEALGEIDLQLRFTSSGANGSNLRQNYKLVFDNNYSSVRSHGNDPYANIGPSRWRIDGTPDEQWVSLATAIKYVTQMRDATRDPSIKANAEKTLATLGHLR